MLAAAAVLLAGCGGGRAEACGDVRGRARTLGEVKRAPDAAPALRALVAAETKLFKYSANDQDALAEVALSIGQANRVLHSIEVDPLRSGTMSPTATVVPAAHRVAAGAEALSVCD